MVAERPNFESTDDAFIDTRVVPVSAQLSAAIIDVPVTDNQDVDAGGVLVRLDDRDYRAALAQARGQVDQAEAAVANLNAQTDAQQARIEQAETQVVEVQAALKFAEEEDTRAQDLLRRARERPSVRSRSASYRWRWCVGCWSSRKPWNASAARG